MELLQKREKSGKGRPRDHASDNLRALLIVCVVLGHCLEISGSFFGSALLYRVIYSFHMPAMIFLLGCYASFSPKRILVRWVVPYVLCQTVWLCFFGLGAVTAAVDWYLTPYWLLWYLMAGVFYQLLIPLYDRKRPWTRLLILGLTVLLALLSGLSWRIGYRLTLSRFLVFQPWFVLGLYFRRDRVAERFCAWKGRRAAQIGICVLLVLSVAALWRWDPPLRLLYGSYPYSAFDGAPWQRGAAMLAALVWIAFLFLAARPWLDRRIPVITAVGQNTLPVFLLHGWVIRSYTALELPRPAALWQVLLLTAALVLAFGNRFCKKAIQLLCLGPKHW